LKRLKKTVVRLFWKVEEKLGRLKSSADEDYG